MPSAPPPTHTPEAAGRGLSFLCHRRCPGDPAGELDVARSCLGPLPSGALPLSPGALAFPRVCFGGKQQLVLLKEFQEEKRSLW